VAELSTSSNSPRRLVLAGTTGVKNTGSSDAGVVVVVVVDAVTAREGRGGISVGLRGILKAGGLTSSSPPPSCGVSCRFRFFLPWAKSHAGSDWLTRTIPSSESPGLSTIPCMRIPSVRFRATRGTDGGGGTGTRPRLALMADSRFPGNDFLKNAVSRSTQRGARRLIPSK